MKANLTQHSATRLLRCRLAFAILFLLPAFTGRAAPFGTEFTYQGRLEGTAGTANGRYDFTFGLHLAASGGTAILTVTNSNVAVSNGLFTTAADFGDSIYNGNAYWIQLGVRTNGNGAFTALSPRQPLTPTPNAQYAALAGTVPGGSINSSKLAADSVTTSALQNNAVTGAKIADGTIYPAEVNASAFGTTFWKADGNAGTTAGVNFLGTTDNQPLELRVNGERALRLEPHGPAAASLAGGYLQNSVAGFHGAAIAGGGTSGSPNIALGNYAFVGAGHGGQAADYSAVVAGAYNVSPGQFSFIGSGLSNTNLSDYASIGGGWTNRIEATSSSSVIAGGRNNWIENNSLLSALGGGQLNHVGNDAGASTIGGGDGNSIDAGAGSSVIAGGSGNLIRSGSVYSMVGGGIGNISDGTSSTVGGGYRNTASGPASIVGGGSGNASSGPYATVAGGQQNSASIDHATISGGLNNSVTAGGGSIGGGNNNAVNDLNGTVSGGIGNVVNGNASIIAGGFRNMIVSGAANSSIGGGYSNTVTGTYATVSGGMNNSATGDYSFAAGHRAKANHIGSFVWADSRGVDFASTAHNQFNIRAVGGVRLSTDTSIFFGDQTRQMLNLFGTSHGIGVQSLAMYFRTEPGGGFSWFQGGVHDNSQFGAGGGNELMRLDSDGNLNVSGTFGSLSDRNAKQNFEPVNGRDVLDKVVALPLSKWSYKTDASNRHIGPMAQDFHAAFNIGMDEKHIATVDADGVALAAIQGLNQKLEEKLSAKDARIEALESTVGQLKEMITKLTENTSNANHP